MTISSCRFEKVKLCLQSIFMKKYTSSVIIEHLTDITVIFVIFEGEIGNFLVKFSAIASTGHSRAVVRSARELSIIAAKKRSRRESDKGEGGGDAGRRDALGMRRRQAGPHMLPRARNDYREI